MDDLSSYRDFAIYLANNGITVVGFDLIYKNRSWAMRLDDLKMFIDEYSSKHPDVTIHICAVSSGTFFAREYAALQPGKLTSLILISSDNHKHLRVRAFRNKVYKASKKNSDNTFPGEIIEPFISKAKCVDQPDRERLTYDFLIDIAEAVDRVATWKELSSLLTDVPILCFQGSDAPSFATGSLISQEMGKYPLPPNPKFFEHRSIDGVGFDFLRGQDRTHAFDDVIEWIYSLQKTTSTLPKGPHYCNLIPIQKIPGIIQDEKPVWVTVRDQGDLLIDSHAYVSFKKHQKEIFAIIKTPEKEVEQRLSDYTKTWFAFSEPPFDDLFVKREEHVRDNIYRVFRYDLSDPIPLSVLREELARAKCLALWLETSGHLIPDSPGWAILYLKPSGEIAALKNGKHYVLPDIEYEKHWKIDIEAPKN